MRKCYRFIGTLLLMAALVVLFMHNEPQDAKAGESVDGYVSLDSSDAIEFGGTYIVYGGNRIELGETAVYLDGSLSDDVAAKYPYVYNNVKDVLADANLKAGTSAAPMTVYIAPYVYWIDDPTATDTVEKTEGYEVPYGMVVNCDYLKLEGLTKDPYNVVIAGNRGQTHGSNGNYTMFRFNVKELTVSNITIGNYCNIDLNYALKPALNYSKRTSTITQAQLADQSGEKLLATNCNFVSRLNLDPINGAGRALYNKCHFESTDDALNGNAVYLECDFDFYGNRPLYSTSKTGSAFLNCKFNCVVLNVETEPNQFFTKEGGTVIAVDCEYKSNFSIPFGIGWTKYPADSLKCYQSNIKHNGATIVIGGDGAKETVDMTGKEILNAYKVVSGGNVYYNTYNLLKGDDDWDPMGVKDIVTAAGKADIPTLLTLKTSAATIESGKDTATVTSGSKYFYNKDAVAAGLKFKVDDESKAYVKLTDNGDGTCTIEGTNNEDEEKKLIVYAETTNGLEAAVAINVKPSAIPAPQFVKNPAIVKDNGVLKVEYELDLGTRKDMSLVSWYRCTDANGTDPVLVAVTRFDEPLYAYNLSAGDVGYYIMAKVEPKNIRSEAGTGVTAVYSEKIEKKDVKTKNMSTDFKNFPAALQSLVKEGFWTVDYYRPADTESFGSWQGKETDTPWVYGMTGDGCKGYGLYQGVQGARLMYTPVAGKYGDMSLKIVVDPAKVAGQGFGSAGQYMDVCLKFDTTTLTGYGLRVVRTKAASDAVTFVLVKYDNGKTTYISDEVIASCYQTGCEITLTVKGNKLTAHVETSTAQLADQAAKGYPHSVDLSADIEANDFGGVAVQHAGTTGSGGWKNTTMLHNLDVVWEGDNPQNIVVADEGNKPNDTVNTGDSNNMAIYAMFMMLAVLAGGAAVLIGKRKISSRPIDR